jgi:hypothetical protein
MGLRQALDRVSHSYRHEVELIRDFAADAHGMLSGKMPKADAIEQLPPEEVEQLKAFAEAMTTIAGVAQESKRRRKGRTAIHVDATERVGKLIIDAARSIKQQGLVAEMCLSHLVAHQEAFTKDYLFELYTHKRAMLKSGASITYERIADHKSMRDLWSAIARAEVDAFGYGSIDDVAALLCKKLNVSLSGYERWDSIREHSYRRNLIVHNAGRVNDVYRKKVGASRLERSTDLDYIKSAAENIIGLIDFMHAAICRKFHLRPTKRKRPNKAMEPTRDLPPK